MSYPSQDRNEAFNEGHQKDDESGIVNVNSSEQEGAGSAQWHATGQNMQLGPIGTTNGNSVVDSERQTYGAERKAQNGSSSSSYAAKLPLSNDSLSV
jgi:hypothetical protein